MRFYTFLKKGETNRKCKFMRPKFKIEAERKEGIREPGREKIELLSKTRMSLSEFFLFGALFAIVCILELTSFWRKYGFIMIYYELNNS